MRLAIFSCCALLGLAQPCIAAFTFLGPTPYLSAEDSPFAEHLGKPNFYLEDFEDGKLNTPGISQPLAPFTHATVSQPSEFTDSVDADDGAIDGSGRNGHSLAASFTLQQPSDPPMNFTILRLAFNGNHATQLPTQFGFVWTDGVPNSSLKLELLDETFNPIYSHEVSGLGDDDFQGNTVDDRFIGVISPVPFAWVTITSIYRGNTDLLEIDHVQYGVMAVPEPSTTAISVMLAGIACSCRYRQ